MRNTFTIAGKELQGYFVQPVAYVVLTVFLLLGGWFFFAMLRQFDEMVQLIQMMGQADQLKQMNLNTRVIDPLLHDLSIVLVIVMPALTMRVFAEEKRTGTYELLLTAPIRTGEIVAGKFLASACFTLITTCPFPSGKACLNAFVANSLTRRPKGTARSGSISCARTD